MIQDHFSRNVSIGLRRLTIQKVQFCWSIV